MSRRRLALAPVLSSPSADVGPSKPSQNSGKKSRGRRARQHRREASARPAAAVWTAVEEAFFAAAPPDEPSAPAQPESFDDLGSGGPAGGGFWAALRRLFARSVPHRT